MEKKMATLGDEPQLFPDCCVSLSKPLIEKLCEILPSHPAVVLSVGSGSGLLERLLLNHGVNIQAVEVMSCPNIYLPEARMSRVPTSSSMHWDLMTAETLIFCYPRKLALVEQYLSAGGALDKVIFLSHRDDYPGYEKLLLAFFASVVEVTHSSPLLAEYEVLVLASCPAYGDGQRNCAENRGQCSTVSKSVHMRTIEMPVTGSRNQESTQLQHNSVSAHWSRESRCLLPRVA